MNINDSQYKHVKGEREQRELGGSWLLHAWKSASLLCHNLLPPAGTASLALSLPHTNKQRHIHKQATTFSLSAEQTQFACFPPFYVLRSLCNFSDTYIAALSLLQVSALLPSHVPSFSKAPLTSCPLLFSYLSVFSFPATSDMNFSHSQIFSHSLIESMRNLPLLFFHLSAATGWEWNQSAQWCLHTILVQAVCMCMFFYICPFILSFSTDIFDKEWKSLAAGSRPLCRWETVLLCSCCSFNVWNTNQCYHLKYGDE